MEKFFGDLDRYLFHHGTHYELYNKMGYGAYILCCGHPTQERYV